MKRTAAALLIAPLWAPVLSAIYAAFFWSPPDLLRDVDPGSRIGMAALIGALLGYGAIIVIGIPAHRMLQRRNRRSGWAYLVLWFVFAIVGWAVVFIATSVQHGLRFAFSYLAETVIHRPYVPLSFGVIWALVGITFWTLVRPDRERLPDESPS